ncbi:unnamed protein product [Acanthoscelides obtectus]|uniref:Uncharacterized protein n=1 Tax=Acanthoscelides obtectus TaxID=200917 RepID=A0A9P0PCS7_ACAOB|nr:unnamed protein product [Acanthoscelides obtectus]CAK1644524.1 hypothetical protein AOBTE_LOCUS13855 [Acanthoscelides obtectus]
MTLFRQERRSLLVFFSPVHRQILACHSELLHVKCCHQQRCGLDWSYTKRGEYLSNQLDSG